MRIRILLAAAALTTLAPGARAADDKVKVADLLPVGVCATQKGSILRREKPEAKWQFVAEKEKLKAGDLLLGLPGAALESGNKAVRLTFLTDFGDSPFPVIECAVVLHEEPKGYDLELTLDRGRADLTNVKDKGAAKVRVRVRDQVFDLTLNEPKTRVALELYGRWAPGHRVKENPDPKEVPAANLVLLVLDGSAELKHAGKTFAMAAPPGPAVIQWDNKGGLDPRPNKLPELPPWAKPDVESNPKIQLLKKIFARYYELAKTKTVEEILQDFIASDDHDFRRAFIVFCGALDRLDLAAPVMRDPKHADLWDDAIRVLRHWIGRGPGQNQKLYAMLIANKYKPVDAETVLQLLHSFSENDLARPETYDALMDYLEDDRVLIRALANWHLTRLVPEGKEFKFNPAGDKKDRDEAVKKWRKLIPPGKLPPKKDSN
jgi:hypothetical protein